MISEVSLKTDDIGAVLSAFGISPMVSMRSSTLLMSCLWPVSKPQTLCRACGLWPVDCIRYSVFGIWYLVFGIRLVF
jgi:hypothetical protein